MLHVLNELNEYIYVLHSANSLEIKTLPAVKLFIPLGRTCRVQPSLAPPATVISLISFLPVSFSICFLPSRCLRLVRPTTVHELYTLPRLLMVNNNFRVV